MSDHDVVIDPASIIACYSPPESCLEAPNTIFIQPHELSDEDEDVDLGFHAPAKSPPIPGIISPHSESTTTESTTPDPIYKSVAPTTRAGGMVTYRDIAPLFSNAGVRGTVTSVSHGTFHSNPATLIGFSFIFRSGDHGFRFRNANVKITFGAVITGSKSPSRGGRSGSTPVVAKFAPRRVYGIPTREGKKTTVGGEFSLEVPAGPVTVGPSVSFGKEWVYELTHRFSTVGSFWSSKHSADWDIVYWDIKENKRTGAGIPSQFNCAVVVERDPDSAGLPFTATVEVTVDTPVGNGFLTWPWSREKPVVFSEEVSVGQQPSTLAFEKLAEEEWRRLAPFEGEWENKFTDEVVRRPSLEGGHARIQVLALDDDAVEGESDDR